MHISGFGLSLEGDLDDDGFLVVKEIFGGGPVALTNARVIVDYERVQVGDVLLAIEETALRGLNESSMKNLVTDSRARPHATLHFGHQFALAAGRNIEPFSVTVALNATALAQEEEAFEWEGEVVDLGKKANKKLSRAKKASDQTSKAKTRLRPDSNVGLSKYSQEMALHPPVWVPPPPEYPECQAAAKCTNANAPHPLSETSKVWGCGNNSEGELGLGHRRFVNGPKAVQLPRLSQNVRRNTSTPYAAATGEGFSIICTGNETLTSGTDVNGCLGLGALANPHVVYFTRLPALSGVAVQGVACGYEHCVLITKDACTFVWGGNENGQLGLGARTPTSRSEPTQIEALRGIAFSHAAAGRAHSLLLQVDGRAVWSFGAHEHGQLGRNVHHDAVFEDAALASSPRALPLPCEGGSTMVEGGITGDRLGNVLQVSQHRDNALQQRVVLVAAGSHHSVLITQSGAVFCWGNNENGQCGVGTAKALRRPTRMKLSTEEPAYLVACGALHTVVVCRDAHSVCSVYSCGSGGCWQLGGGISQADRSVPQLVESMAGRSVSALACGMFHTLCLVEQDQAECSFQGECRLWAWGADQFGDMRHVDTKSTKDPTRMMRGSDTAARGLAGCVRLDPCVELHHGIQLRLIVSGCVSSHSLLLLSWQLPWKLERVLWIGVLKASHQCLLSLLPLDGTRTSFILSKIIDYVSAPS